MTSNIFQAEPMTAADISEVLHIEKICGLGELSAADYAAELENEAALMFVVRIDDKICGFVSARLLFPAVEILNIGVLPEARRQGIGEILLCEIVRQARAQNALECWLEVRDGNDAAREFYRSQGFEIVGRRKNYYSNPTEDAILLTATFSSKNPKK